MKTCIDCKHVQRELIAKILFLSNPIFLRCGSPRQPIDSVTGLRKTIFCEVQRAAPATRGYCNPEGEFFEPKA